MAAWMSLRAVSNWKLMYQHQSLIELRGRIPEPDIFTKRDIAKAAHRGFKSTYRNDPIRRIESYIGLRRLEKRPEAA